MVCAAGAQAGETIVYRYDELGRLKRVDRSGTANNGVGAEYAYDPADNRAVVVVGGANPAAPATVVGGGFEAPDTASYAYNPTGSFLGQSGLAANGSAWGFAAGVRCQGRGLCGSKKRISKYAQGPGCRRCD